MLRRTGAGTKAVRMRAMVLDRAREPLRPRDLPVPWPCPGQVRLRVRACGVCRTDLHVVDGELPDPKLPLIPGHQIVGVVDAVGSDDFGLARRPRGRPVAGLDLRRVPLLPLGAGEPLRRGALHRLPRSTAATPSTRWPTSGSALPLPDDYPDLQAAPLLCAGLIGYRALGMAGDAETLGLYGFGAAAHILAQVARYQGREVFAFTRPGDDAGAGVRPRSRRRLGGELGRAAAGAAGRRHHLRARRRAGAAGAPRSVRKGGTVVCAGIHMSDIPSFPYEILWEERVLRSVANLTRRDGEEFLQIAPRVPVRTDVSVFPLEAANEALSALRDGKILGSAVLAVAG